jgi:tetratricopeptide (TPR) repeat protein
MKRFALFLLLLAGPAHACLWVDGTTIDGDRVTLGGGSPAKLLKQALDDAPENRLSLLIGDSAKRPVDPFKDKEREGVILAMMGNYEEAISLFTQLEADSPGRYSTAANLGTIYELAGELELAVQWISEGMRRNPDSHKGTEWLHVAILETKLKLELTPDYLSQHHVIEVPESPDAAIVVGENRYSTRQVLTALYYQLSERMVLVKPHDAIVADLLYSYAILQAQHRTLESAIPLLELSREYGSAMPQLLEKTLNEYRSLVRHRILRERIYIFLGIAAVLGALAYSYKKKWFFLSSRDYRRYRQQQRDSLGLAGNRNDAAADE